MKMDIEGGEVMALPGMRRLLSEKQPLIFLELHGQQAAQTAWEILIGCDYRLCKMEKGYPQFQSLETVSWKTYMVAIPPSDFQNNRKFLNTKVHPSTSHQGDRRSGG